MKWRLCEKKREKEEKKRKKKILAIRLGVQRINMRYVWGNVWSLWRKFCAYVNIVKCSHLSQGI